MVRLELPSLHGSTEPISSAQVSEEGQLSRKGRVEREGRAGLAEAGQHGRQGHGRAGRGRAEPLAENRAPNRNLGAPGETRG